MSLQSSQFVCVVGESSNGGGVHVSQQQDASSQKRGENLWGELRPRAS